jgi:hypothetical protein
VRYLLDSDVLIEILRGNAVVGAQILNLRQDGHTLCYSPVTRAEIYGGLRPGEEELTAQLLARLLCLPIDASVGEQAGRFLRLYRRSLNLEIADALVAAASALSDSALITFNVKHYPMPDLTFHHLQR